MGTISSLVIRLESWNFAEIIMFVAEAAPLLQYARRHDVENTLNEWRTTLLHIEAVLTDAEQKQ